LPAREVVTLAAVENLDLSIRDLAGQLQALREVIDEVREDISWATRNGPMAQPFDDRDGDRDVECAGGIVSVAQTVNDVSDQVSAATIGLLWIRDQIRAAVDALENSEVVDGTASAATAEFEEHQSPTEPSSGSDILVEPPTLEAPAAAKVQKGLFDGADDYETDKPVPATHPSAAGDAPTPQPSVGNVCLRESQQPEGMDSLTDDHQPFGSRFQDAIVALSEGLENGHSEQLQSFLKHLNRFHHYSFGNVLLISLQRPDATHVAGFGAWKKLGRRVLKGEKGIAILAPVTRRRKATNAEAESEDQPPEDSAEEQAAQSKRSAVTGFRTVYVFDVSQTDGDPLPEFPTVQGEPGVFLERLQEAIKAHGVELVEDFIPGGALGVCEGERIVIRPDLSEAEKFKTLAHEFAHRLLHQGERRSETTKTIRETEAEAVAFAVCHAAGFELSTSSSDYIQLYNGSTETLMSSLDSIRHCTGLILRDVLPEIVSFASDDAD